MGPKARVTLTAKLAIAHLLCIYRPDLADRVAHSPASYVNGNEINTAIKSLEDKEGREYLEDISDYLEETSTRQEGAYRFNQSKKFTDYLNNIWRPHVEAGAKTKEAKLAWISRKTVLGESSPDLQVDVTLLGEPEDDEIVTLASARLHGDAIRFRLVTGAQIPKADRQLLEGDGLGDERRKEASSSEQTIEYFAKTDHLNEPALSFLPSEVRARVQALYGEQAVADHVEIKRRMQPPGLPITLSSAGKLSVAELLGEMKDEQIHHEMWNHHLVKKTDVMLPRAASQSKTATDNYLANETAKKYASVAGLSKEKVFFDRRKYAFKPCSDTNDAHGKFEESSLYPESPSLTDYIYEAIEDHLPHLALGGDTGLDLKETLEKNREIYKETGCCIVYCNTEEPEFIGRVPEAAHFKGMKSEVMCGSHLKWLVAHTLLPSEDPYYLSLEGVKHSLGLSNIMGSLVSPIFHHYARNYFLTCPSIICEHPPNTLGIAVRDDPAGHYALICEPANRRGRHASHKGKKRTDIALGHSIVPCPGCKLGVGNFQLRYMLVEKDGQTKKLPCCKNCDNIKLGGVVMNKQAVLDISNFIAQGKDFEERRILLADAGCYGLDKAIAMHSSGPSQSKKLKGGPVRAPFAIQQFRAGFVRYQKRGEIKDKHEQKLIDVRAVIHGLSAPKIYE